MPPLQPTRLEIFLTNRCNLRCTYCSSRHITAQTARALTPAQVRRAVAVFAAAGRPGGARRTVCFTGGEPLLEFGLLSGAVRHIRGLKEKFDITVNTNGTLLDREKAAFLLANDVYLAVSLDGGKEVHDLHRKFRGTGGSVYDSILKNLGGLPPDFLGHVRASVTVTSRTLPSLVGTVSLLQDLGFRFVELGLDAYGRWTPAGLAGLRRTLAAIRRHYAGLLRAGDPKGVRRVFSFSLENKQQKAGFYTPAGDISLSPDGLFYPSDTLATAGASGRSFAIGSLERGLDLAKLGRIYAAAAAAIPRALRAEGAFSPVDRYLYCRAHGLDPRAMIAEAAAANRIFAEELGGLLELQRLWRELAKNKGFGDLAHAPKYSNPKRAGLLALELPAAADPARLRPAADYMLYSGAGRKTLRLLGAGGGPGFEAAEAALAYAAMKAAARGLPLRLELEVRA